MTDASRNGNEPWIELRRNCHSFLSNEPKCCCCDLYSIECYRSLDEIMDVKLRGLGEITRSDHSWSERRSATFPLAYKIVFFPTELRSSRMAKARWDVNSGRSVLLVHIYRRRRTARSTSSIIFLQSIRQDMSPLKEPLSRMQSDDKYSLSRSMRERESCCGKDVRTNFRDDKRYCSFPSFFSERLIK